MQKRSTFISPLLCFVLLSAFVVAFQSSESLTAVLGYLRALLQNIPLEILQKG